MSSAIARASTAVAVLVFALFPGLAPAVVWDAGDRQLVAEPAEDIASDHLWWDGTWAMSYYQARKVLDLGLAASAIGETIGLSGPREAANVNALDEVPDSAWFTNRHAHERLSAAELSRGPNLPEHAPAKEGKLVVSGKAFGMTSGFVVEDAKKDRYVVKFDPPNYPEVPTGAEMVCTKILHALGWNVPENFLFLLDPKRLELAPDAWIKDDYNRKQPFDALSLGRILARARPRPDGRFRVVASRYLPGKPKGGFATLGTRTDDPNDTVPHENRRDLRGLRVVAAWLNFTDARRGNFHDAFVADPSRDDGRGHVVHSILDFSSALGAGNDDWKPPRYGHEYFFDLPATLFRLATLGLVRPAWADVPLAHPALGYFDAESFDPKGWRTTYPNPLFDAATLRDSFWGARLVVSLNDADLEVVARAGQWSDPDTAELLAESLQGRRRKIASVYLDPERVNPIDRFRIAGDELAFRDLGVDAGAATSAGSRYRARTGRNEAEWKELPRRRVPLPSVGSPIRIELQTSRDGGKSWSPATAVTLERSERGRFELERIERETR